MRLDNHQPSANGARSDVFDTAANDLAAFEQLPERIRFMLNHAPVKYSSSVALQIYRRDGEAILTRDLLTAIADEFPGYRVI